MNQASRILVLPLLLPLVAGVASCGGAAIEGSSGAEHQALSSNGPRTAGGGCDAEFSVCYNTEGSPVGVGEVGAGGGGADEAQCGPNGEYWKPGTGCHPNSRCFQDIDNYNNALRIKEESKRCTEQGGTGGEYPSTNGGVGGYVCSVNGVDHATSLPTTDDCMKAVKSVTTSAGEGLMGEPTRTEPPPSGDATVTADDGGAADGGEGEDVETKEERVQRRIGGDPELP